MPEIAPFAAIRFNADKLGADLAGFLAPPYDVLEQSDKNALLATNPRNIVAIDLPFLPPKTAGPPEVYEASARLLLDWLKDGTLIHDRAPALYVYHQRFVHQGRGYTRKMFIARARLTPFSEGQILPHERTFGGPKEDRLALMIATKCNLSPVFGLYSDTEGRVEAAFAGVFHRPPGAYGTLDGVENLLWVVPDRGVTDRVVSAMAEKKVYIADGHHRYETALRYREEVAREFGGTLPENHPAAYVMVVLAGMDDPGCLILPYHRVLTGSDLSALLHAWSPGTVRAQEPDADLSLVEGSTGRREFLQFTNRAKLAELEPAQPPAWHQLDTAYLHRYLIDELLTHKAAVEYVKSEDEAVRIAREQNGVALLMKATPMTQLRAVSEAGGLMPQKSTYFHPKLATGLTVNSLT